MVPEEDMCYSCLEARKYSCIKCTNAICNRCTAFESNEETPGWIAGETYILLDVLLCSIAEYFYELCRILASP